MQGFEENDISKNSNGGTEITKRALTEYVPAELVEHFQIIPSRVRDINPEKIRVYWQHDLAGDPEVNHLAGSESRDRFHQFVFSSNWQLNDFVTKLQFPRNKKVSVIETPIKPIEVKQKDFNDKIRLIYFSTPHRGLDVLVPVFEHLAKTYSNIHLDVFSSFKIYGWEDSDQQYEPLFEKVRQHPQMTYHGSVDQATLRNALADAHILAYPNIWEETSCRVLIESMSAGLVCVHPNLAALPDTSGGLTSMYQFDESPNEHAAVFHRNLDHAIQVVANEPIQNYLKFVKAYADSRFNIDKISSQWESLLTALKEEYPTVESRVLAKQMFTYST